MQIDFKELEVLIAIMEQGSFRSASEKLHKSQSSISYAIKNIEKSLGVELFDRSTYKPTLTSSGELVYNKARILLGYYKEFESFADFLKQGVEKKISVVFSIIFPTILIQNILENFKIKFPQTQLVISFESFDTPAKKLISEEADLIIATDFKFNEEVQKDLFTHIEMIPVVSAKVMNQKLPFDEKQIATMTEIVVGHRAITSQETALGLIEASNIWHVPEYGLKKQLIEAGLGWGYMPNYLINKELESGDLLRISTINPAVYSLFCMKKKSKSAGPALEYLWELLRKAKEANLLQS